MNNVRKAAKQFIHESEMASGFNTSDDVSYAEGIQLDAFLAGAEWQKERDAKLMETIFNKVSRYPTYHPRYIPGELYSPFAEAIRTQDSNKEVSNE